MHWQIRRCDGLAVPLFWKFLSILVIVNSLPVFLSNELYAKDCKPNAKNNIC